jgi:hypothetical protein
MPREMISWGRATLDTFLQSRSASGASTAGELHALRMALIRIAAPVSRH